MEGHRVQNGRLIFSIMDRESRMRIYRARSETLIRVILDRESRMETLRVRNRPLNFVILDRESGMGNPHHRDIAVRVAAAMVSSDLVDQPQVQ